MPATTAEKVTDFASGSDHLVLWHFAFSVLGPGPLSLDPGQFVSEPGAVAHDANDYILYDTTTGKLYYDADGNDASAAVNFATLTGHSALLSTDIFSS